MQNNLVQMQFYYTTKNLKFKTKTTESKSFDRYLLIYIIIILTEIWDKDRLQFEVAQGFYPGKCRVLRTYEQSCNQELMINIY